MTAISDIRERLTEVRPPGFSRDVIAAGMVRDIENEDGSVTIFLEAPPMPPDSLNATVTEIRRAVGAMEGVKGVDVRLLAPAAANSGHAPQSGTQALESESEPLEGVRSIVAVASTKGGVGKSTVAVNLALAMQRLHQRVGLLDADVYGPSLPTMLGISGRPRVSKDKRIHPLEKYGLQVMSLGFFLDDNSPVTWRGPLVAGLVRQFLRDVNWGELEVLVVDLPPGNGDAQLTLLQQVPLAGGVMITTPQEVAKLDVERGIAMFQRVDTTVLGIVENMSYYECPKCGKREELFGSGGGAQIATHFDVPFLGRIPLLAELRAGGDAGKPIVAERPEHPVSQLFLEIAGKVLEAVEAERTATAPPTIIDD
jgi:ATP-binding protein involved in chromosome partitioning